MKYKLLSVTLFLCLVALLVQCKKGDEPYVVPDIETPDAPPPPSLVGKWKEGYPNPIAGTTYTIEFLADSTFRLDFEKYTDIYTSGDTCTNTHTDHIRGKYWSKDGYLRLSGKYCDFTFSADKPNCEGYSSYVRFSTCQLSAQVLTLDKADNELYPRKLKRQ